MGLLRTSFPLLPGILSELGSTSDNFSYSAWDFVRTWVYFGQLFLFCLGFCPNLGLLRTSFPLLPRDFVRTWVYFGQVFLFCLGFCPNLGLLRTIFPLLHEILSEPGSTSDNFPSSARHFVRIWTHFGPNTGLLHGTLSKPEARSTTSRHLRKRYKKNQRHA